MFEETISEMKDTSDWDSMIVKDLFSRLKSACRVRCELHIDSIKFTFVMSSLYLIPDICRNVLGRCECQHIT